MVNHEEIQKIARLSKLFINEDELDTLTKDMNDIIAFADQINEASFGNKEFDNINQLENVFRKDEVSPSFNRDQILQNANEEEDGFFVIRKRKESSSSILSKEQLI